MTGSKNISSANQVQSAQLTVQAASVPASNTLADSTKGSPGTILSAEQWIIDFGATDHMTNRLSSIISPIDMECNPNVSLPNGTKTRIRHTGSVQLDDKITLDHVLHLPDFKYNLFLVSKFTSSHNCVVTFYPDFCLVQDLWSGKLKGIGKKFQGLYFHVPLTQHLSHILDIHALAKILSSSTICNTVVNKVSDSRSRSVSSSLLSDFHIWHQRLGHVPNPTLRHINKALPIDVNSHCSICPLAKQARIPLPLSQSISQHPFDLLHLDVWGPYKVLTYGNARFFLTIVDDYSFLDENSFDMHSNSESVVSPNPSPNPSQSIPHSSPDHDTLSPNSSPESTALI
ncbi:uncharacterized protein LOC116123568 [Pistacia vera]|uniref:uncharacterized protein LOC116123568 n=1 Tax=Pistacia vera TaxID=55513 RepID=UPI0012639B13|nr:uncharacterized protein LOC116123568 [Pistacia vera]